MVSPKKTSSITARFLSNSVDRPSARASENENTAKKVKLVMNPTITPRGLCFPLKNDPDNTIGKIGRIQGESMVTMPAKKAKTSKIIIS